jgi:hypothetical protein
MYPLRIAARITHLAQPGSPHAPHQRQINSPFSPDRPSWEPGQSSEKSSFDLTERQNDERI